MAELIVFCTPQRVYAGKQEQDIARNYTRMAIEDYDKLISFDKIYLPFVATPDYESIVGQKERRDISLTLFAQQPMIRVGNIIKPFFSSSYLFNPKSNNEELLLPDLDVIQIDGVSHVHEAANAIKQFYQKFGWQTYIFDGKITDLKEVHPTSNRFNQPIEIMNPDALREIAKEKVGYSLTHLCF